jgi:hypothetical protein
MGLCSWIDVSITRSLASFDVVLIARRQYQALIAVAGAASTGRQ